jgi:hypothetical protein
MQVSGDFSVGMMSLTNDKGQTRRYVKRRRISRPFCPQLSLVSRMQAALLSGKDGEPLLKGDHFPPTVVIEQSAKAVGGVGTFPADFVGSWAYSLDEKGYWIRDGIGGFESEARALDPAALVELLRSFKPEFAWSAAEVRAELDRYLKEQGHEC